MITTVIVGAGRNMKCFGENLPEIIYAIEPEEENFKCLLTLRHTLYETPKILIPVKAALSNVIGEGKLHITAHAEGHSLKERLPQEPESITLTGETQIIPLMTWNLFIDMFDISHVNYCVVDIEGMEREFLEGMTAVYPRYILLSSYHHTKFKDCATDEELHNMLTEKGYRTIQLNEENLWGVYGG